VRRASRDRRALGVLIERLLDSLARFVEAPRDRSARALLDDRGLRVRQTLERDEDDRRAHLGGQRIERADDLRVRLTKLRGASRITARVDLDGALDTRVTFDRRLAATCTRAPRVERSIHREAIDPREKLTPTLKAIEPVIRAQEDVLGDVVRF